MINSRYIYKSDFSAGLEADIAKRLRFFKGFWRGSSHSSEHPCLLTFPNQLTEHLSLDISLTLSSPGHLHPFLSAGLASGCPCDHLYGCSHPIWNHRLALEAHVTVCTGRSHPVWSHHLVWGPCDHLYRCSHSVSNHHLAQEARLAVCMWHSHPAWNHWLALEAHVTICLEVPTPSGIIAWLWRPVWPSVWAFPPCLESWPGFGGPCDHLYGAVWPHLESSLGSGGPCDHLYGCSHPIWNHRLALVSVPHREQGLCCAIFANLVSVSKEDFRNIM